MIKIPKEINLENLRFGHYLEAEKLILEKINDIKEFYELSLLLKSSTILFINIIQSIIFILNTLSPLMSFHVDFPFTYKRTNTISSLRTINRFISSNNKLNKLLSSQSRKYTIRTHVTTSTFDLD